MDRRARGLGVSVALSGDGWRTVRSRVFPSPSATPFTVWYSVILLGTTVILRWADPGLVGKMLAWSSTDAHNLWHHPLSALLASALWLPGSTTESLTFLVLFVFVLAALERRVGCGWTAAIFASGHVVATLLTELPIVLAIQTKVLPKVDGRWLDIGVSYGLFAAVGVLLLMLPGRIRWIFALAAAALIGVLYSQEDDPSTLGAILTAAGHALAGLVGVLGWRRWLLRRGLVGSLGRTRATVTPRVAAERRGDAAAL